ncbi:MAG: ABC transporter substrate-binding protein [Butyrivibrio sp.]|nr:ABC transporter substrate-binding protein [Butyrivibrio sp.]
MKLSKFKKHFSILAVVLILAMVLGTVAGAIAGAVRSSGVEPVRPDAQEETVSESGDTDEAKSPETAKAQDTEASGQDKDQTASKSQDNSETGSDASDQASGDTAASSEASDSSSDNKASDESAAGDVTIRIAALKGPTTIGLVNLINDANNKETETNYEFEMYTAGSDIMAAMVAGKVDIGLVPSNVACVMNNKVEGGVTVIDINTLGVLECVSSDKAIKGISDLAGKTLYMTGQGATPEYTVNYLLKAAGIKDCKIEFKSEPTEIVSAMAEDDAIVSVLPQPFATAAQAQNDKLISNFKLEDEWKKFNPDSGIVTGVTVVSNAFLKDHEAAVKAFIADHEKSAQAATADVDKTAALVVEQGIIAKEPLAKKAIPSCSVVCLTGPEMKTTLQDYLKVLFSEDPKSVGGSLPEDSFYYTE